MFTAILCSLAVNTQVIVLLSHYYQENEETILFELIYY